MAEMMGYSEGDQAILESIHKKLNPGQQIEPAPKPKPLPAQPAGRPQPMDVGIDEAQPEPEQAAVDDGGIHGEGGEEMEGQPAEGQSAEGDEAQPAEGEGVELPPTVRVTVKDENGKDVEQDVPLTEVVSGYMRQADYTRKTQALAKERAIIPQKIAETEKRVAETTQQFGQALQNLEAFVLYAAAPELQGVNWNQLAVENPTEHVRLTQRANTINATLQQIRNHQAQIAKQSEEARLKSLQDSAAEARETLNREIPGGWNDDLYVKLQKGAVNHYGFLPEEIGNVVDARIIMALHDGLKYRELVSGKPIAQQRVAKAPLAVRPGAAPTKADVRQSAVEKAREAARKSGSIDDALALMQAKRARQAR